ncbi:MAG TPA: DUF1905 domain-containing protein [Candidatus Limnocylindria bacterium]|jgi:hypothetical protein
MDIGTMSWEFPSELTYWRGPSPYHFIPVPEDVSTGLRGVSSLVSYGWGVIPVSVRIEETVFTTSLFPKDGGYLIPVKDTVRRGLGLSLGDSVTVELIVGA